MDFGKGETGKGRSRPRGGLLCVQIREALFKFAAAEQLFKFLGSCVLHFKKLYFEQRPGRRGKRGEGSPIDLRRCGHTQEAAPSSGVWLRGVLRVKKRSFSRVSAHI